MVGTCHTLVMTGTATHNPHTHTAVAGDERLPCRCAVGRDHTIISPALGRRYADDRDESEPCQRGTDGCSIDHDAEPGPTGSCETW